MGRSFQKADGVVQVFALEIRQLLDPVARAPGPFIFNRQCVAMFFVNCQLRLYRLLIGLIIALAMGSARRTLFFLTPVPEPATWISLAAGAALLGGKLRRRDCCS